MAHGYIILSEEIVQLYIIISVSFLSIFKNECYYQCWYALVHHHLLIYDHTGPVLKSCGFRSCDFRTRDFQTSGHVTSSHVTSGHMASNHVTSGHVTSGHVTSGGNQTGNQLAACWGTSLTTLLHLQLSELIVAECTCSSWCYKSIWYMIRFDPPLVFYVGPILKGMCMWARGAQNLTKITIKVNPPSFAKNHFWVLYCHMGLI